MLWVFIVIVMVLVVIIVITIVLVMIIVLVTNYKRQQIKNDRKHRIADNKYDFPQPPKQN